MVGARDMGGPTLAVVGLGYVGLPLALALARHFNVIGFDISESRVAELHRHEDRTDEVSATVLRATSLQITGSLAAVATADVFIVTVPTPVDKDNNPDLGAVIAASRAVGKVLKKGDIVVYESTVYPGVTEDVCGPVLAEASGLVCGEDFHLGYSPERINPGDREHTVENITKVIAGQTPAVVDRLQQIYGAVTGGNVFVAKNIRTAEAAKVIENAQRDINIAFINEVAIIFSKLGLSTHDVLDAARSKWNFLKFEPGLVGGHCIGVDPFYLAHLSKKLGHEPEVILSGRRINDGMAKFLAERIHAEIGEKPSRILMLGLTFKENVPDLRNSKVGDLIAALRDLGHDITVHDPLADPIEAETVYGIKLLTGLEDAAAFDCVVGAVPHTVYREFGAQDLNRLVTSGGLIADIKAIWRHIDPTEIPRRWEL